MSKQKREIHPAANLFPMMTEKEYQGLKADIAEHGQREDITEWCGKIIDGRNRLRACEELGIEPLIAELDEEHDPYAYVISHNLHRRHLTTSQRAKVAANLATLKRGRPSSENPQNCGNTTEEAAKLLNVSTRSVEMAKQVVEHGSKELNEAVDRGEIPVSFAAKFVAEEPDKKTQTQLVKQGKEKMKEHITEPTPFVDDKEEEKDCAVSQIKKLWKKWSEVQRTAVRVWIDENYLNV